MRYPLAYAMPVLVVILVIVGFYRGGVGFYGSLIGLVLIMPLLDEMVGKSIWPSEQRVAEMSGRAARMYDLMLWLGAIASVGLLAWALWAASTTPLAWWQLAGLVISVGLMSGTVGIVVSHELLHRGSPLCFPIMGLIGYSHFCITHIRSHHVVVATPDDAASSRYGESLYAFIPRWLFGGLRAGWEIERRRLARAGRPAFSIANRSLVWHGFSLLAIPAIWLVLGPVSALLFIGQALVAMLTLALIDYIEHYGLARARLPDGGYERVTSAHTWNCNHLLTNISLFNLGRHTAHHNRAAERYHRLGADHAAPQLPHGYAMMMLISLVPPLWFRVMHRELAAYHADRTLAPG
ncbi:MAG: alkane 1-monooxygenase [Sphingomonadaceae bacterium]|nr:alkane 1-monooxygenase [Sphingomonadaceae bacterium]